MEAGSIVPSVRVNLKASSGPIAHAIRSGCVTRVKCEVRHRDNVE